MGEGLGLPFLYPPSPSPTTIWGYEVSSDATSWAFSSLLLCSISLPPLVLSPALPLSIGAPGPGACAKLTGGLTSLRVELVPSTVRQTTLPLPVAGLGPQD